jgi:hypothetical protein
MISRGPNDTPDPATRAEAIVQLERRRQAGSGLLGPGTLACPACDAPVALAGVAVGAAEPLSCPFCAHSGRVREFLTLGAPTRPAHVAVRVRRVR